MINQIKTYLVLGIVVLIVGLTTYYLKTHSIVKDSVILTYKGRITLDSLKINYLDSMAYSIQQELDICKANEGKFQIVIAEQKKRASEAMQAEKVSREAIEHYEVNGLMRYFVFDKQGLFKKGCYKEVFEKPDNICK